MTNSTTTRNTTKETLGIWAVQFFGTAALAAFAYWWLTWPDEKAWQVIASLGCAAIFGLLVAWLECATLARFAYSDSCIGSTFTRSLRRVPAFLLWMLVMAACAWLLLWSAEIAPQASTRMAQILHMSPRMVLRITHWKLVFLWLLIPALLLPLGAAVAANGFAAWKRAGLSAAFRPVHSWHYWVVCGIAIIVGVYLPHKLIQWIPIEPHPLKQEAWHMAMRLSVAYLLAISAWVGFTRFLGKRTTRTAAS